MCSPKYDRGVPTQDAVQNPAVQNSRVFPDALTDLGMRLQHYIAAQDKNPDLIAEAVGLAPDDFALAITGHLDLPFTVVHAVLGQLDVTWWHFFGSDMLHHPTLHDITLESETWHAMDAGMQAFVIRRDCEHFRTGDMLRLYEKVGYNATGRVLTMQVTCVDYAGRNGGPHGYVGLGLQRLPDHRVTDVASHCF